MRRRRFLPATLVLAAVLALSAGLAWTQSPDDSVTFGKDRLSIETAHGVYAFQVELAQTPPERAHGLMFRRELAPDHGMLFIYPREDSVLMWMKNTYIPLDMLFIAADGRITRIVANAKPLSTDIIASGPPAKAVLELAGGTASSLGIEEGDRIIHPDFAAPSAAP